MNWYDRMNSAVNYIEDNLCGDIDFAVFASIMCQSTVSFQRTFSIITDISVHEYIRRRRLTLAAFDLQNSREKVIDIALKYGYDSPESFARVFREVHGVTPTDSRKEGTQLKSFPRITFLLTIKGVKVMDYRIESKEAFKVYGIEEMFTPDNGKNLVDIPNFWMKCMDNGRFDQLIKSTNDSSSKIHAICDYFKTDKENTFPYMLFVYKTKLSDTQGFKEVEVPAATWAIFTTEKHAEEQTSGMIQELIRRVYSDWLPTASYNKVDGYELELYYNTDDGKCYCETWIRVTPK